MSRSAQFWAIVIVCWRSSFVCTGDVVLFEDNFDDGLSDKWQLVGLKPKDYRIRDGALELRVQPGKLTKDSPMLKVVLPFNSSGSVIASVDVTVLDDFARPKEFAGPFLIDEDGREFGVKKQFIDGKLLSVLLRRFAEPPTCI